jgi:hypothetical protein
MAEAEESSPETGTIGVAVVDGNYAEESFAEDLRREVRERLSHAGLKSSPMDPVARGSTTGAALESVVENVWAAILILAVTKTYRFFKDMSDRKHLREFNETQRFCLVQFWDNRGEARDAVELIRLLPHMHAHLSQIYPNRAYSFVIMSAMSAPRIEQLNIKLENYDDLQLTVWQAGKMLRRMSDTPFAFLYLEDGPYHSRQIRISAV